MPKQAMLYGAENRHSPPTRPLTTRANSILFVHQRSRSKGNIAYGRVRYFVIVVLNSLTQAIVVFGWLSLDSFVASHLEEWTQLSECSTIPNVYLAPGFLIPAARYLAPDEKLYIAHIFSGENELLMLGAFTRVEASLRYPYPRAHAFRSKHSFQTGLLIRAGVREHVVEEFVLGLYEQGIRAIRFEQMRADSELRSALKNIERQLGWRWFTDQSQQRAVLKIRHATIPQISKRRIKDIQRNMRRLDEALRDVEFRVIENSSITSKHIDDFLRLEQSGWKRATALKSNHADERFFRTVIDNMAIRDQVFICELRAGGDTVASTINFKIGESAFAFKVGHDDQYRKYSPGILVEFAYLEWCAKNEPSYTEIDSGAMPGSYIEDLWPNRCEIQDGHLVAPGIPTQVYRCKHRLKRVVKKISTGFTVRG